MKKLPIGTQAFEKLRNDDSIYIDKTEHIYNLINSGSIYFFSRPRRFGKS
ncbi:MAG: AAA family ATPase, partial [Endomicrobium sp.]|nr:AAA family ATPase [Endomicrobium sp.]